MCYRQPLLILALRSFQCPLSWRLLTQPLQRPLMPLALNILIARVPVALQL
jgi:hypothetical protein